METTEAHSAVPDTSPFTQPSQHKEFEPRTEADEGLVLAGVMPAAALPHATIAEGPTPGEMEAAGSIGSSFCAHMRGGAHASGSGAFLPPHHEDAGQSTNKGQADDDAEEIRESVAGGGLAGLAVLRQPFTLRGASASGASGSGKGSLGHVLQDVYLAGRGALKGLVHRVEEAVHHQRLHPQPSAPAPSTAHRSLSDDGRIAVVDYGGHDPQGPPAGRTSSLPADVAAMRDAARRLMSQALESMEDQPKAASAVAGRMMGMDRYGHAPAHAHHTSTTSTPTSPTLTRAGSAVKEIRDKAQDMRERALVTRRSITHTPQAAAEMAGRMMGRDSCAPPSRRSAPNTPWPRGSSPLGRPPITGS